MKTLVCARKGVTKWRMDFSKVKRFYLLLKRMTTVLSSVINYKKNTFSASSAIIDIIKACSHETLNFSNSTTNGSRVSLEGDFWKPKTDWPLPGSWPEAATACVCVSTHVYVCAWVFAVRASLLHLTCLLHLKNVMGPSHFSFSLVHFCVVLSSLFLPFSSLPVMVFLSFRWQCRVVIWAPDKVITGLSISGLDNTAQYEDIMGFCRYAADPAFEVD